MLHTALEKAGFQTKVSSSNDAQSEVVCVFGIFMHAKLLTAEQGAEKVKNRRTVDNSVFLVSLCTLSGELVLPFLQTVEWHHPMGERMMFRN